MTVVCCQRADQSGVGVVERVHATAGDRTGRTPRQGHSCDWHAQGGQDYVLAAIAQRVSTGGHTDGVFALAVFGRRTLHRSGS